MPLRLRHRMRRNRWPPAGSSARTNPPRFVAIADFGARVGHEHRELVELRGVLAAQRSEGVEADDPVLEDRGVVEILRHVRGKNDAVAKVGRLRFAVIVGHEGRGTVDDQDVHRLQSIGEASRRCVHDEDKAPRPDFVIVAYRQVRDDARARGLFRPSSRFTRMKERSLFGGCVPPDPDDARSRKPVPDLPLRRHAGRPDDRLVVTVSRARHAPHRVRTCRR